jgi:plasmid stabilization system protein ParE
MDYQVALSLSARSDIQTIVHYISLDNPEQAWRFGMFLIQQARSLGPLPERGRVVPEFGDDSIREIIVRAYRIVYRFDRNKRRVEIIRFWHAGRGTPTGL